jgi:uncharacterized membrane protein YgcG
MKRIASIVIVLTIICMQGAYIGYAAVGKLDEYDYSRFRSSKFVYDNTGELSEDQAAELESVSKGLNTRLGVVYSVIIVNDYTGDMADFVDRVWEEAGYIPDVIALGLNTNTGEFHIYTYGEGIEIMCDSFVDALFEIVDVKWQAYDTYGTVYDFLENAALMTQSHDYNQNSVTTSKGKTVYRENSTGNTDYDSGSNPASSDGSNDIVSYILLFVVAGLAGGGGLTFIELKKHKPVAKATNADEYIVEDGIKFSRKEDAYIRSTETRVKIEKSNSSGGHVGGGRTSSRSSGRSSGGRSGRR